jgi:hypothetical protein
MDGYNLRGSLPDSFGKLNGGTGLDTVSMQGLYSSIFVVFFILEELYY